MTPNTAHQHSATHGALPGIMMATLGTRGKAHATKTQLGTRAKVTGTTALTPLFSIDDLSPAAPHANNATT